MEGAEEAQAWGLKVPAEHRRHHSQPECNIFFCCDNWCSSFPLLIHGKVLCRHDTLEDLQCPHQITTWHRRISQSGRQRSHPSTLRSFGGTALGCFELIVGGTPPFSQVEGGPAAPPVYHSEEQEQEHQHADHHADTKPALLANIAWQNNDRTAKALAHPYWAIHGVCDEESQCNCSSYRSREEYHEYKPHATQESCRYPQQSVPPPHCTTRAPSPQPGLFRPLLRSSCLYQLR